MQGRAKTKQDLIEKNISLKQIAKAQEHSEAAHMKAEQALRDNESLLKEIIDKNPISMAIVAMNGTIEYLNHRTIETFGYELTDIPDMEHWWKLAYPDAAYRTEVMAQWMGLVEKAIALNSEIERREYQITCKNGTVKTVAVFGTLTTDKLFAMFDDITDRKHMEKALRNSEQRFQQVAESAGEWIWEVDANGVYTYASPALEKILGYQPEEIVGKRHFHDFFHPEDREVLKFEVFATFTIKQPFRELINRNIHRDGRTIWISTSGTPYLDDAGNLLGYRGADTDITNRKTSEDALKASEDKYRSLASTVDRMVLVDRNCVILFANEAFMQRFGSSEAIIGKKFSNIHSLEGSRTFAKCVARVLKTGNPSQDHWFVTQTGKHWLRTYSPVKDKEENVSAVTISYKDVTEFKQIEESLRKSEEKYRSLASVEDRAFVLDRDCRYLFANENYLNIFAPESDSVTGRTYGELHNEERSRVVADAVKYVFETGNVYQSQHFGVQTGQHFLQKYSPIRNSDGTIYAVTVISIDVTLLKLAEEALRESEAKYRALASTVDSLVLVDRNCRHLFANKAYLDRLGTTEQGIIGKAYGEFHHDESSKQFTAAVKYVFETGNSHQVERLGERSGRYWLKTFSPVKNTEDVIESVTVAYKNITEQKQVEEELRKSAENYRSLATTVDALFSVDRNYVMISANENFLKRLRPHNTGPMIGESIDIIHHPSQAIAIRKGVDAVFSTSKPYYDELWAYYTSMYLIRTFSPVFDETGNVVSVTVASKDMTERKQAEAKVRDALKEKELLLREIHHRVKNNMQVISSLLTLQGSVSGHPEIFENCQQRIRSMALIHEKTYKSGDFARIDLADYTRELARELIQAYALNPEKIGLIIEAGSVYIDINMAIPCGLILNELITNALKHAFPIDSSGELRIMINETEHGEAQIVLHDNGLGLPEDVDPHQPKGVGLYLVNGLVKNQLGGQWEVVRDHGTEVRITFPA